MAKAQLASNYAGPYGSFCRSCCLPVHYWLSSVAASSAWGAWILVTICSTADAVARRFAPDLVIKITMAILENYRARVHLQPLASLTQIGPGATLELRQEPTRLWPPCHELRAGKAGHILYAKPGQVDWESGIKVDQARRWSLRGLSWRRAGLEHVHDWHVLVIGGGGELARGVQSHCGHCLDKVWSTKLILPTWIVDWRR